jgi:hypothetical protein
MWDLLWTKWHWDRFFPRVLRFSPVNFIPPVLHYREKQKTNHLHHRAAQEASRLRCVRSICCGALHPKKQNMLADVNQTKPANRTYLTIFGAVLGDFLRVKFISFSCQDSFLSSSEMELF